MSSVFADMKILMHSLIHLHHLEIQLATQKISIVAKGQIISECPFEILDFPKIPRKI